MDNSNSESLFLENIFSEENVIRCPICYLIPFISIENSNEQIILNLKCLNNHEINKPIKELYYESKKYQINSIKCKNCEEKDKLFYCTKCYGFYCEKELHSLNEGHNILIPIDKIDSQCREQSHNNYNFCSFCLTDNKNICSRCEQDGHEGHEIEKFKFIKKQEIVNYENLIKKWNENLSNISTIMTSSLEIFQKSFKQIKDKFSLLKENYELQIKLFQDIIKTYKLNEKQNTLNYQIIQNIKNIRLNDGFSNFILDRVLEIKNKIDEQFEIIKNNLKDNNLNKNKEKKEMKIEKIIKIKEENKIELDKKENIEKNEKEEIEDIIEENKKEKKKNIIQKEEISYEEIKKLENEKESKSNTTNKKKK